MRIQEEIHGDVVVMKVTGALLVSGPDVGPFHDHVRRLVKTGTTKIVVDFSRVKWFGSAMLGVLIASLTTLCSAEGDLRLTGITEKINSILMVTELAGIFQTVQDLEGAVASFAGVRA